MSYCTNEIDNENKYKIQIMKKDKIILSYTKQLAESKNHIERLQKVIGIKEKDISNLKEAIIQLNEKIENSENENLLANKKIDEYKLYYESQMNSTNLQMKTQADKNNQMQNIMKENEKKINEISYQNEKLKNEIKTKEREISNMRQSIIEYEMIIENMTKESKQNAEIGLKLNEYESIIKATTNENENLKEVVTNIKFEYDSLTNKLNKLAENFSKKESQLNNNLFLLNNEVTSKTKELQTKNDEWEQMKKFNEKLVKENEDFTYYVTSQANELNEFIEKVIEKMYTIGESIEEESKIDNSKRRKEIKFEIINDTFEKTKAKILQFAQVQFTTQSKLINQIDEEKRKSQLLENENTDIRTNNLTLLSKHEEIIQAFNEEKKRSDLFNQNYLELKENYAKLFNDYQGFTEKKEVFVNEINSFFVRTASKFENLGLEKEEKIDPKENLSECISSLILQYKKLIDDYTKLENQKKLIENESKIKENSLTNQIIKLENDVLNIQKNTESKIKEQIEFNQNELSKQKETMVQKIKKITGLLDESKKIISHFEQENKFLRNENEKLNYRYKMLQISANPPDKSELIKN